MNQAMRALFVLALVLTWSAPSWVSAQTGTGTSGTTNQTGTAGMGTTATVGTTTDGTDVTLRIGQRYRGPELQFNGQPEMVPVTGASRVYWAKESDYDLYRSGTYWYYNYNGDWYRARTYSGPYTFVSYRSVPRAVYSVPTQYRRHWTEYRDVHYRATTNASSSHRSRHHRSRAHRASAQIHQRTTTRTTTHTTTHTSGGGY